jgi:hypothetical protein
MPTLHDLRSNSPATRIRIAEQSLTIPEESIVTDARCLLKPAQVVEEKLQLALGRPLSRISEGLRRRPR